VLGLRGLAADTVYFGAVTASAMTTPAALKVAPPVTRWGGKQIAVESLHHLVYAAAAGLTYGWLKMQSSPDRRSGGLLER
jgi:hypothetical protein